MTILLRFTFSMSEFIGAIEVLFDGFGEYVLLQIFYYFSSSKIERH